MSNTEDKSTERNTDKTVQETTTEMSHQGAVSRKPLDKLWLVLAGGIGGAVIVGAVWVSSRMDNKTIHSSLLLGRTRFINLTLKLRWKRWLVNKHFSR